MQEMHLRNVHYKLCQQDRDLFLLPHLVSIKKKRRDNKYKSSLYFPFKGVLRTCIRCTQRKPVSPSHTPTTTTPSLCQLTHTQDAGCCAVYAFAVLMFTLYNAQSHIFRLLNCCMLLILMSFLFRMLC
jgi:hypothetical protein